MNEDSVRIRADRARYTFGIDIMMVREGKNDLDSDSNYEKRALVTDLIYTDLNDYEAIHHPPILTLSNKQAQELMDDLYSCGVRPTEGTGSAGSLKATQDHLKDMQKLVFEYYNHK